MATESQLKKDIGMEMEDMIHILNAVPVNIIITDNEGVILWCNDTVCNFTGYKRSEMIGEKPSILKSDLTDPKVYEEMWDTIKTKRLIWRGKLKNKKKNGEVYEEELQIIPIKKGKQPPSKFIGIQLDVTEIEKLRKRENVKEAIAQAVQKIEQISKSH